MSIDSNSGLSKENLAEFELPPSSKLDVWFGKKADQVGQGMSRRSFLRRFGELGLATFGFSIVGNVLPVNRVSAHHQTGCGDWWLCGMTGTRCCVNCNGTDDRCPPGATIGTFWETCCPLPGWTKDKSRIRYEDCCNCNQACDSCADCSHPWSQHPVCGSGQYCCTKSMVVGKC